MPHRELTEKQDRVLTYLTGHVDRYHEFPSFRTVQYALNYASPNAVTRHIEALQAKGYVVRRGEDYALVDQDYYMTAREVDELHQHVDELIERVQGAQAGGTDATMLTERFIKRKRDALKRLLPR